MNPLANIIFDHTPPLTFIAGTAAAALLLTIVFFWLYLPKKLPNLAILASRLLFLGLLIWCLLLPQSQDQYTEQLRQRFVVLLDRSASMNLTPSEDMPSRWETAQTLLEKPWIRHLQREFDVDFFVFGNQVESLPGVREMRASAPDGGGSHLRDALRGLTERYRGQDLAGMVVLSDGLDTRELDDSWAVGPWNFPVYTADLESARSWEVEPDVRVENILTQRRVMVGWETSLTAVISGQGAGADPVRVQLYREDQLIQEIPAQIPADGGRREIQFSIANPEVGNFTYTVRIPPLPDENNVEDNEFSVSVQVIEAENRMLYIESSPRWESRYLSRTLRANPDLTPTILMFLGGQFRSIGESSTINLDLLSPEDLAPYSVLLVGDFSAETMGQERAEILLNFVEEGGSLVFVGGPSSWGENGLIETPLRALIPFRRNIPRVPQEARFTTRLTPEGRQHPAFIESGDNLDWADLPPVLSVFPVADISPGATTLVEVEAGGQAFPLIVAQRYSDGRILSVLTDSLWRWQLAPREDRPYLRFWNQVLRWMGPSEDDRETQTFDLFADADQVYLGDSIELTARLPERMLPQVDDGSVRVEIQLPDRRRMDLTMIRRTIATATGQTFPGYGTSFTASEPGLHRAVGQIRHDDGEVKSAPFTFYVRAFTAETEPRPANRQVLETLALSSNGRFQEPQELSDALSQVIGEQRGETRVSHRSLWNLWLVLSCLMALLVLEWILRKFRNYV